MIIRIPCSNNSILNVDEPKYSMGLIFLFIISIQHSAFTKLELCLLYLAVNFCPESDDYSFNVYAVQEL